MKHCKKTLFLCLINLLCIQLLQASDNGRLSTQVPPLLPAGTVIENAVLIPESGYYYTPQASQETIILGPLSPCVGMQICSSHSDACLYVHQHAINDPHELNRKVRTHLIPSDHQSHTSLNVTLFSRTDDNECDDWSFAEGAHKKRVMQLADTLAAAYTVQEETIYYNQTSNADTEQKGNIDDRWIICMDKKLYRFDPRTVDLLKSQSRIELYEEAKMKKAFGLRIYSIHPWSIWKSFNVPLYRIKKANLKKINNLPCYTKNPMHKYFYPSFMQKAYVYICLASGALFLGGALGAVVGGIFNYIKGSKA